MSDATASLAGGVPAGTNVVASGGDSVRECHEEAAPWPYQDLDLAELRASGWRPTPIRELVLKVYQRCNLACPYCYVYTHADQTWRDRRTAMSEEIWSAAVSALARHARRHRLANVRVVLHGGEPLLFGAPRLARLAVHVRTALPEDCRVEIGLQTNGVLLNQTMAAALRPHGVAIGVSVDGSQADHDRNRITRKGRGTFAATSAALEVLRRPENQPMYAGILCTVQPETDPLACWDQLAAFEPPLVDFLLPHANWRSRPVRTAASVTPYADWLIAIFDRWYGTSGPRLRIFDDIIALLLGGPSRSEQVGLSPAATLVIESDGAIEQVDVLKSAYHGACATGLHITSHDLDDALDHPGVVARQIGLRALSAQCQRCSIVSVCGGGHYAHRYEPVSGFRNPSIYCRDMLKLIAHVRDRIALDVKERTRRTTYGTDT